MDIRYDYFEVLDDIQVHNDTLLVGDLVSKGKILRASDGNMGSNEYYKTIDKYVSDVIQHSMNHVRPHLRHDLLVTSLDHYFAFFTDNDELLHSDAKTFIHNFIGTKYINSDEFVYLNRMVNTLKLLFSKLAGHEQLSKPEQDLESLRDLLGKGEECIKECKPLCLNTFHTFESGAVRDIQEGKGRVDLVPLDVVCDLFSRCSEDDFVRFSNYKELALIENFKRTGDTSYLYQTLMNFCRGLYISPVTMVLEVSKHFEDSLSKYKENNWKLGIPVNSFINSASRHYLKWLHGDTDEPHDRAFVWNIMCCISTVNSNTDDSKDN